MDLEALRKLAKRNAHAIWYKKFCDIYKTESPEAAAKWLKQQKEFSKLLPHIDYYVGKTGHAIKRIESYALVHPTELNICAACGKPTKWGAEQNAWRTTCSARCAALECEPRRKETNLRTYGVENASQAEGIKRKRVRTFKKRFGVDNPRKSKIVKKKIEKTMIERYGVKNASQSDVIKSRKKATSVQRCGYEHWTKDPEQLAEKHQPWDEKRLSKARATCLRLYGVDNPWKLESVQEQIRLKHFAKYGANPGAVFNGYARRVVEDRFGDRHIVQGYEDLAVNYFSKQRSVSKIVTKTKQLPRFRYTGNDGKLHNYHPDIKVVTKTTTHIIEVKSDWTLNIDLDKNMRKFRVASRSCVRKGFNFWVFVFYKGEILKSKNPTTLKDLEDAGFPVRHHQA